MIVIGGAMAGAALGGMTARRRGGSGADIGQYAAVYAIAGALAGLLITIMIERML